MPPPPELIKQGGGVWKCKRGDCHFGSRPRTLPPSVEENDKLDRRRKLAPGTHALPGHASPPPATHTGTHALPAHAGTHTLPGDHNAHAGTHTLPGDHNAHAGTHTLPGDSHGGR